MSVSERAPNPGTSGKGLISPPGNSAKDESLEAVRLSQYNSSSID